MQVQVSGKHVTVGDALSTRITDQLSSGVGRYFERGALTAEVVVSRDGHEFKVECLVRLATGQQLDSRGSGVDAYTAFDECLQKLETRIRRYKRRLKNHHRPAREPVESTSVYVLRPPDDEDDDETGWDSQADVDSGSHEPPAGVVIAETAAELRTMTVSMAVLELDLTESQTIVFRNAAHGGLSVVYRRPDGNIGWIDPERTKPMAGVGV